LQIAFGLLQIVQIFVELAAARIGLEQFSFVAANLAFVTTDFVDIVADLTPARRTAAG
jgi:hypothetical protein